MSRSEAGRRYPLSVKPSAEVATARTSIDERKFRDRSVMHLYLSSITPQAMQIAAKLRNADGGRRRLWSFLP